MSASIYHGLHADGSGETLCGAEGRIAITAIDRDVTCPECRTRRSGVVWPRPIPVSERLPDRDPESSDMSCALLVWQDDRWHSAIYDFAESRFWSRCRHVRVMWWMPQPPSPYSQPATHVGVQNDERQV